MLRYVLHSQQTTLRKIPPTPQFNMSAHSAYYGREANFLGLLVTGYTCEQNDTTVSSGFYKKPTQKPFL